MANDSAKSSAANDAALSASNVSSVLGAAYAPALRDVTNWASGELRDGMPGVTSAFSSARKELGADYAMAEKSSGALLQQQNLQAGGVFPGSVSADMQMESAYGLKQQEGKAQRSLNFQESQSKMQQYGNLMNILMGGTQQQFGLGNAFANNQMGAIGMMNGNNQLGGMLGGAATGASAGMAFGPYGAAAGGILGGVGGALSGG
jgi:hypothetical protein